MTRHGAALTSILIAPDTGLATRFTAAVAELDAFQIVLELKTYPSEQTLDIRVRQLHPDIVLLDVGSNLDLAVGVVLYLRASHPEVTVVAIDRQSGSDIILRILRAGASEFLYAPFDPSATADAVARLLQLRRPERGTEAELGRVCVFSSVKPGSGASTLATQTAFALRRLTSQRVLLSDFDLVGGTIGFCLKLNHGFSAVDALGQADGLNASRWTSLVAVSSGLDVLPAPMAPYAEFLDWGQLQGLLAFTRTMYDWIVLDLPVIFQRTSLLTIPEADHTFLVSTSELPSLHLARRSILMLEQLGFAKDRFHMIVNRVDRRDGISRGDIEKLFNCPVHASIPNDYFSLHRVVTLGQPMSGEAELGRAIDGLAAQLAGTSALDRKVVPGAVT